MTSEATPPHSTRPGVPLSVVDAASNRPTTAQIDEGDPVGFEKVLGAHVAGAKQRNLWAELTDECGSALALLGAPAAIGITSCQRGEGRTTVALATALAQSFRFGRTTVLVEADLASPRLAKLLGAKAGPGLAEVARGEAAVEDCIQWMTEGFGVLAAGKVGGEDSEGAAQLMGGGLVADLQGRWEALVLDLPPFAGPGVGMAKRCPSILLVVRAHSTPLADVRRAAAELDHPPVIMNWAGANLPRWMRNLFRERP